MKKFRSWLIVLVVIVVSLGFYRGWFTVDNDKVNADAKTVQDKAKELTGKTSEKVREPGDPVRDKAKSNDP